MTDSILEEVKKQLNINENFRKAEKGTRSKVFVSDNFVIKISRNIIASKNEAEILRKLTLNVAPKFIAFYTIRDYGVLVEKKLSGQAIDDIWKDIKIVDKKRIIIDISESVYKINQQKKNYFWSAQFNENFKSYKDLLFYKFKVNQKIIFENKLAHKMFLEISNNINEEKAEKVFSKITPVLLHGDLIMHNLLTDSRHLTGILDWEFAQFGDPFYDLARVVYYQECAKAYADEKRDEYFEYDYTTRLIEQLKQHINWDSEKYKIIRSLFFIDTIIWALGSEDPIKNLSTLQPPRF